MSWFRKLSHSAPDVPDLGYSRRSFGQQIGDLFSRFENAFGSIFSGDAIENWIKGETHAGATKQFKEESDIGLKNTMLLNEQSAALQQEYFDRNLSLPAQMRQAKEAGINPMTIFSNGADVSSSGGIGSGGSAPMGNSGSGSILATFASLISAFSQSKLLAAQAEGQEIENKWKDRNLGSIIQEREANIRQMNSNVDKIAADTALTRLYIQYYPGLFGSQILQNNANARQLDALAKKHASDISLNEAEIKEIDSKIKLNEAKVREANKLIEKMNQEMITLASQAYLNDQMVDESSKRMEKYDAQIKVYLQQAGFTEKEVEWYAWNHSKELYRKGLGFSYNEYLAPTPFDGRVPSGTILNE